MVSFERAKGPAGWRYSTSYRTRKQGPSRWGEVWVVEHWDGRWWKYVGEADTYAEARELATEDQNSQVAR